MARLILSCLGAVELSVDGESLTPFIRGKAGALLIFLAVEFRRAHGRDALAAMLWPEHDRKRALQNLRQLLVVIRRTLPADLQVILAERNHIQFVPSDLAEIDVHAFERKAAGSERALASLYRGPFLVDHPDMKSEEWDTWIRARRQDFELQAMDAFQRLGEEFLAAGDFEGALSMARRRLDCDPWNEDAHRAAMLVLALTGRRNAALNQFAVCRDRLDEDLGVAPDPATLSLFEQIRDGKVVPQVAVAPADPSERRHVTALLVQKMFPLDADPEDLLNQGLDLERLTPLVEGLGGLVERCAEDWLLAYFGGHGSWERAAQRAVSAGLAIVAGEPASLRAAVHSGPAVMHGGVTSRITGALSQVVRPFPRIRVRQNRQAANPRHSA
ncbi:MAG: BTAD domain-containing putative transcriptional regulator, partial [Ignavibacteriales bacterium]